MCSKIWKRSNLLSKFDQIHIFHNKFKSNIDHLENSELASELIDRIADDYKNSCALN